MDQKMKYNEKYNKSDPSTQNNRTIENLHNQILSNNYVNDVKQNSSVSSYKSNEKQNDSKQIVERKEKISNTLNNRIQLNVQNYITELHKALIKECNENLLDCSSWNARLDFESLINVTNRTLNAVKVQNSILVQ